MDIEVLTPDIGIDKVEIIEILVKKGNKINENESILSVESQKSVLEIPSPFSGIIKKIFVKVGDFLILNTLIMIITVHDNFSKKMSLDKSNKINHNLLDLSKNIENNIDVKKEIKYSEKKKYIYAPPNIRRLSRILNINLSLIVGSGRNGRIIAEDLYSYQKNVLNKNIKYLKNNRLINKNNIKDNLIQKLPLTKRQQISGKNILNTWKNVPHVTQFDESDITELNKFRKNYNNDIFNNNSDKNISLLSFIVKCVTHALQKFPRFNSILDSSNKKIIIKENNNIGIAIETFSGLLVPVLKNIHNKSITYISGLIKELVYKAKNNQLNLSDTKDGTFTISSLGNIGGVGFTPIINSPEVCILGVSKSIIKPIWNKKKFYPRLILPFSISYDHRVIDGADAVRFTTYIGSLLKDVRNLLM